MSESETGEAQDHAPKEAPLPPPSYLAVNGAALGFVAAALPFGALALFAFYAGAPVVWGAALGFVLALLDTALTGYFLRRSAEHMEDPSRAQQSGELRVLSVSFLIRLFVIALVTVAIFRRLPEEVNVYAFVIVYLALHFVSIGGWALFLQRRATQLRKATRKEP